MADFSQLKAAIRAAIYENTDQAITGEALQTQLLGMVDAIDLAKYDETAGQALVEAMEHKQVTLSPTDGIIIEEDIPDTLDIIRVDFDAVQAKIDDLAAIRAGAKSPFVWLGDPDIPTIIEDSRIYTGSGYIAPPCEFNEVSAYIANPSPSPIDVYCYDWCSDWQQEVAHFTIAPWQMAVITATYDDQGAMWSIQSSGWERTANKVTAIDQDSTDEQYPSAKCVYDIVGDIETLLANI